MISTLKWSEHKNITESSLIYNEPMFISLKMIYVLDTKDLC